MPTPAAQSGTREVRSQPPGSPPSKILVVDDSATSLQALEAVLDAADQKVVPARSAREALDHLLKEEFAVVLLDVRMPEMDGFELASLIRSNPRFKSLPILFVTGAETETADLERGYLLGAVDFIRKPVNAHALRSKVSTFVELYRTRQELERRVVERTAELQQANADVRTLNATLESRVEERTAQFRDALAELNTFAYTVAHDLRSPLRAMSGFSDILLSQHAEALGETGADLARRIATASTRMDNLITDLLAYSRLTREEIPLQRLDLGAAMSAALDQVSSQVAESKASVEIQKPLPSVMGHPLTVSQAIANLLSNAMKFVGPGVTPRIRVRSEIRGLQARLWIEDNGIGIPLEHHDRLFRVFERLHSQETYPGTGIGLSIVRRAMERMGGHAGLEPSAPGSRFWIELPLSELPPAPQASPAS